MHFTLLMLIVSLHSQFTLGLSFGDHCSSDADCGNDFICESLVSRSCICRRGRSWDNKRCTVGEETTYIRERYDLNRDVIVPSVILGTLIITASICYKLFCIRKNWRRQRRGNDMARVIEEAQLPYVAGTPQPATWIASYRGSVPPVGPFISVFGTVERSTPPCLLLPVGPPPYEEALKHKVILSSYQPPSAPPVETTPL